MSIAHVLAVVPVSDIGTASAWYEQLLGCPPTNRPMEILAEWQVTDTGWVQVTQDAGRAGSGLLNVAVDDLDEHLQAVHDRGLAPGDVQTVTKGVQLSSLADPDGNTITFIGSFRVVY